MNEYFKPWIGSGYKQAHNRILIIGDSHYCGGCETCGVHGMCSPKEMCECNNFTRNTIRAYLDFRMGTGSKENWMTKTFYPFDKIFFGKEEVTIEESLKLWNNVAFYNFLQTAYVKEADNTKYATRDYTLSVPLAFEIIQELRPDLIIVWGNRAYNSLPSADWENGSDYYNGYYKLNNQHIAYCFRIYHPSRANIQIWHQKIIEMSKLLHAPNTMSSL